MTVKDCKPGDATCAQDMDPFLSQDSENLLGRVLAGMTHLTTRCLCTLLLLPTNYCLCLSAFQSLRLTLVFPQYLLTYLSFILRIMSRS